MKIRIALVVIGLVILPTGVLSLMAGRTLGNWEDVLRRGLETAAADAIESVADQTQLGLVQDLKRTKTAMLECLAIGMEQDRLEAVSQRLSRPGGMVRQVYLFLNPLGFVYPSAPGPGLDGGATNRLGSLTVALAREIAAAGPSVDTVRLTADDHSYLFSPIPGRRNLYVGYEVDAGGLARQISELIAGVSGGGLVLVAEGPGLRIGAPRQRLPGEVVVSDTLGGGTGVQEDDRDARPLAVGRLYRPLDFIRVSAFVKDPDALARSGRFRVRLYGWGILLMAGVIGAGIGLLLREAAVEIRRARERSDFVIGVSHDLRTPLASMRMLAESLHLGRVSDAEKQKQFLGTIVRECQRLSQLIERVLFFVRFGQGALIYRSRDTDVGLVVSREVEAFRTSVSQLSSSAGGPASRAAGAITLTVQAGVPRVMADDGALAQVVLNLLDNAWKYGRRAGEKESRSVGVRECGRGAEISNTCPAAGGIECSITNNQVEKKTREVPADAQSRAVVAVTVEAVERSPRRRWWESKRRWVRIAVADHGDGIRAGELRKLFRQFYRAPGAGDKNTSGVGLGLALCKHMAVAHGGWIEAQSEVGRGSTFSVYLPVGEGKEREKGGGMKPEKEEKGMSNIEC